MFKKLSVFATVLAFSGALVVPLSASAALSPGQIDSIIGLLHAFGADQSVIVNVELSLAGGSPQASSSPCVDVPRPLYLGLSGPDVTSLQQFLGVLQTGYFGPLTEQAVQQYQSSHGIVFSGTPDTTGYGVVGPQTIADMECGNQPSAPAQTAQTAGTFTATPVSGSAPLKVRFDMAGAFYTSFRSISFGDGQNFSIASASSADNEGCTAAGRDTVCTISHTYAQSGTYTATLLGASGNVLSTQTITVTAAQTNTPAATIDQSSLTSYSGTAVLSGAASGVSAVTVSVKSEVSNTTYYTRTVSVVNGRWTTTVSPALSSGAYKVVLTDSVSQAQLATGDLIIGMFIPQSATIDQSSLTTNSPSPVITGSVTNVSALYVYIAKGIITMPQKGSGSSGIPNYVFGSGTASQDSSMTLANGRWSMRTAYGPDNMVGISFLPGVYTVGVYDDGTGNLLTTGTLTVSN